MYKFQAKEKYNALKALRSTDTLTICRRYKVNRTTLWRWKRLYDGTLDSLAPKFSRKNIHHPDKGGKVERSHRNDNERFYRYLRYYSFDDLQKQMSAYLTRSNNIPTCVLRSSEDNRRWLSPNEKEKELLKST